MISAAMGFFFVHNSKDLAQMVLDESVNGQCDILLDLAINPFTLKGYRGFSIELSLWVPKDEKSRRCLPGNMVLNFLQPNPIWPPSAKLRIIPFSLFAIYE